MKDNSELSDFYEEQSLFVCLAEQLKMPLVQISSLVGSLDMNDVSDFDRVSQNINEISKVSLRLIDGFLMSLRMKNQAALPLEPVPVGSMLYDVAQSVSSYAKISGCELELEVSNKCGLAMTNSRLMKNTLANLLYSFINSAKKTQSVRLSAGMSKGKIVTGVYSKSPNLSKALLTNARKIKGISHQPMQGFVSDNAAGVFVAESLLNCVGNDLMIHRSAGETGLVTILTPSKQLSLV